MVSLDIPENFGLVVLFNAILPTFTLVYLGSRVIAARKKFGVNLPTMYTTDDKKKDFNNYQRGHQNALETASQFLVASIFSGLRFPVFTAVCGLLWCYGRCAYAWGYSAAPGKRYSKFAAVFWLAFFGVLFGSIGFAIQYVTLPF